LEKGARIGDNQKVINQFQLPDPLDSSFFKGIFDHDVLSKNMKRIDKVYQQNLKENKDLDERYFMN
jgi:hypothetical protein